MLFGNCPLYETSWSESKAFPKLAEGHQPYHACMAQQIALLTF